MNEIKNVSIPTHYMSRPAVAKKFGTCLGVDVQLVTTKAGNWQPTARASELR